MHARLVALVVVTGCTVGSGGSPELAPTTVHVDRLELANGAPYFVAGELGRIPGAATASPDGVRAALDQLLPAIADTVGVPTAQLVPARAERDPSGMTHVRYRQVKDGLRVVGGELVVHVAADGTVRSVNTSARDAAIASRPSVTARDATSAAVASIDAGVVQLVVEPGVLAYEIANRDGALRLTWEVRVIALELLIDDLIYVDAHTGQVVDRHPQVFTAKSRRIYNNGGQEYDPFGNPPTQIGMEGSPGAEPDGVTAYDNTGAVYDCYQELFGRDSFDNAGAILSSVVHAKFNGSGANAIWYPPAQQMAYGDGDPGNTTFAHLVNAFDVTAHELTHAVTSATADLVYMNESGALNEGMSDIMAAVCEWRKDNKVISADTWLVGEDIFTPATPGDALRYMANPTADAVLYPGSPFVSSRDFYPDRFLGDEDSGGVHFNSGIANLAFNLLSVGGKHPRNKTTVTVPAIGIERAGKIFERALTGGYFMMNTTFLQARTATEQVAMEIAPGPTKTAVGMAWFAVGVGPMPAIDTVPPTVDITSPADGARVTPGFQVAVNATDDQGILDVELKVDNAVIGNLNTPTPPYNFTTAGTLAPGSHTIVATATDGFTSVSDTVTVTVAAACVGENDDTCAMDEHCELDICAPGKRPDGGGCCSTSGRGVAGSLALALATASLLRRRRRR